ncbi:MAG: hypothetical protein DRO39_00570 [Thermoprotei archaeon]|nr:MAG: hypothetical protein DRO39_00570 [Thermoprotei archaeon]
MDGADAFLDHDVVVDRYGRLYVVFGNYHPFGRVYAYLKYIPVSYTTHWCRAGVCYERVLPEYSVDSVRNVSGQKWCYDHFYGGSMPYVPRHDVAVHYRGREALVRIVRSVGDELERDALELVTVIADGASVSVSAFGVTGSILPSIHNPKISDIDITVYGCDAASNVVDFLMSSDVVEELSPEEKELRARRIARSSRVPLELARALYRKWKRFRWRGRLVSLVPVDPSAVRRAPPVRNRGCVVVRGFAEPRQCTSLYYPAYATLSMGSGEVIVRLYDASFIPVLWEGGEVEVSGLLQESDEHTYVSVGTAECRGYVRPLKPF